MSSVLGIRNVIIALSSARCSKFRQSDKTMLRRPHLINRIASSNVVSPIRGASTTVGDQEYRNSNPGPTLSDPKPFSSIPCPKGWPILGTALEIANNTGKVHLLHCQRVKDYGRIWREKAGAMDFVMVASAEAVEDLIRNEGDIPYRRSHHLLAEYYRVKSQPEAILVSNGENWRRMRSVLEKPILKPSSLSNHVTSMRAVSSDFLNRLDTLRDDRGDVNNIDSELLKWSLEAAGVVLYSRRLGCLSRDPPPGIEEFIESVGQVNTLLSTSRTYPLFILKTLKRKLWNQFNKACDKSFAFVQREINKSLEEPEAQSLVSHVMAGGTLTSAEMYSNVSEITLASGDTTSTWAHFILWELCHRPSLQEKVYQEIMSVVGENEEISYSTLSKLKYTTGFVKEILRLHPPIFINLRKLKHGGVICGYKIPPETTIAVAMYALGRDPNVYKDPEEIKPERWIRSYEERDVMNSFAFVPFGWGQRSCIGRRIAVANVQLLLIELLRRFKLTTETKDLNLISRLTLTPGQPIQLKLTPRK
ncbi:cytochrome P450 27C1 [Aplysia californica]|uniref:Cytochrome P450 27C1 n=1 Tax=Aplysia californica TaxID=6500 RepID=A0ABM0JRG5_APLCA|nr:cytochrome P450 27C1 [Aplysia californica]